jgi:hypothetical protein
MFIFHFNVFFSQRTFKKRRLSTVRLNPGFLLGGGFSADQFALHCARTPEELLSGAPFPREVAPAEPYFLKEKQMHCSEELQICK